jgi:hypothetical protein
MSRFSQRLFFFAVFFRERGFITVNSGVAGDGNRAFQMKLYPKDSPKTKGNFSLDRPLVAAHPEKQEWRRNRNLWYKEKGHQDNSDSAASE